MNPVRAYSAGGPAFVLQRAEGFAEVGCLGVERVAADVALEDDLAMLAVEHGSEHPQRLHVGFEDGFGLGALVRVLLA